VKGGGTPAEAERADSVGGTDIGFEALYRREYEPMLRVAYLLLDSADAAQEAVHDAFAKVYERWDRIDDHGAYLRTSVSNRCRDLQRRRRLERARTPDPTASYADLGARELLDALAKLPIRQRAAVVLRYYEGLSEAEVAAALDIPVGTVKSTVSRALTQLREAVER
jgi:RNA polymerase sigma-70 factor (sigma-E family)